MFVHCVDREDVYLSWNASSRKRSTSGQCSSSSANACNIGGSSGRTKSVILGCPGLAFVPAISIPNWRASWAFLRALLSSSVMSRRGSVPSTQCRCSRGLYRIVDPSDCDVRTLCCSSVNSMPLSLAAFSWAFKGSMGWIHRMSSSSICSNSVVGCPSVLGIVSPRDISSISWSPLLEPLDETSTTSSSGWGVNGLSRGLTCKGAVLGKGLGLDCQLVHISGCCWK